MYEPFRVNRRANVLRGNRIRNAAAMQATREPQVGVARPGRGRRNRCLRGSSEPVHSSSISNTEKTRGPRRAAETCRHIRTSRPDRTDHRIGDRSTSSNRTWTPGTPPAWASGLNKPASVSAPGWHPRLLQRHADTVGLSRRHTCRRHRHPGDQSRAEVAPGARGTVADLSAYERPARRAVDERPRDAPQGRPEAIRRV